MRLENLMIRLYSEYRKEVGSFMKTCVHPGRYSCSRQRLDTGVLPVVARHCMLKILGLLLIAVALGAVANADGIPGQAIVRLGGEADPDSVFTGVGVTMVDSIVESRLYLVEFPITIPFETKRWELLGRLGVRGVSVNEPVDLIETHQMSIGIPSEDATPVYLKGEQPQVYYEQPAVYSVGLDSVHLITEGAGVRIAVIDNGIDYSHPLFADLVGLPAYDFVDNDEDPSEGVGPLSGHGTFVTGLVRLAAPEAEVLVVRAFDGDGLSTTFQVTQALMWAVSQGAAVVNMSFGTSSDNDVLAQACAWAVQAGAVLVASAGNDGQVQQLYPASYSEVTTVTAIDTVDLIASFSNGNEDADVCAPGVNVCSAFPAPHYWGTWSGTSFSTPLVSAIAGLVRSVQGGVSSPLMKEHVRETATRELAWGVLAPPDPFYGYGRVDAFTAVLEYRLGDMDNSGTLDIGDLTTVSTIATTGSVPEGRIRRQADMNLDGVVDLKDVKRLERMLFPVEGAESSVAR